MHCSLKESCVEMEKKIEDIKKHICHGNIGLFIISVVI